MKREKLYDSNGAVIKYKTRDDLEDVLYNMKLFKDCKLCKRRLERERFNKSRSLCKDCYNNRSALYYWDHKDVYKTKYYKYKPKKNNLNADEEKMT